MNRQHIGEQIAAQLYSAETAIDRALAETAALAARLPGARADAYLSVVTGQKAFDGVSGAISALVTARAQLVRTHATLAALARALGLDVLAIGPLDKPGDGPPVNDGIVLSGNKVNKSSITVVNKSLHLGADQC